MSTEGGVAADVRLMASEEGGGGLSLPTSSSSLVHFSRPPAPLLQLPPSASLQSRRSPLESAFDMLRFCGDMHTSGPLHSSDDDEDEAVEHAVVVAGVAPVGKGVRLATFP